jgi:ATP-dependent DNA ligase
MSVIQIEDLSSVNGTWVEPNVYRLPEVKYIDNKGNERMWEIYIELKNIDMTPLAFKESFYNNEPIPNAFANIYTEYGLLVTKSGQSGTKQRSAVTPVLNGKNIGKANKTNIWTQALRDAISEYNKYIKTKVKSTSDLVPITNESLNENTPLKIVKTDKFPPMALSKFAMIEVTPDDGVIWKVKEKDLEYSPGKYLIQPKFDGERTVTYYTKENNEGTVTLYSRMLTPIPGMTHLRLQLLSLYEQNTEIQLLHWEPGSTKVKDITIHTQQVYFDGELYKHGMPLQEINSIVRKATNDITRDDLLNYYIFDCFVPEYPTLSFIERQMIILTVFNKYPDRRDLSLITLVQTEMIDTEGAANVYIVNFIRKGYEGAVIKLGSAPYDYSYNSYRSKNNLKVKQRFDDEYKVVGFTQGTSGRDIGALIWKLATANGKEFNAVPKAPDNEKSTKQPKMMDVRRNMFKEFTEHPEKFQEQYLGKMMTVEYEDLSKDGIPLRAKALHVRHYV